MRRIGLLLLVLSAGAFALTNLAVDKDTASSADTVTISGTFADVGGEIEFFFFYDRNGNQTFDNGVDLDLEDGDILDGNEFDSDGAEDGSFEFELFPHYELFTIEGTLVCHLSDEDGETTASIYSTGFAATDTYISGTVTGPDGPMADVKVEAEGCWDDDCHVPYTATDANGDYTIYLPTAARGGEFEVVAFDQWGIYEDMPYIPPQAQTPTLSTTLTDVDFEFEQATHFVKIRVADESDNPLGGVTVTLESHDETRYDEFERESDDDGEVLFPVYEGDWDTETNSYSEATDQDYMRVNYYEFSVDPGDDTVEIDLVLYSTDATVSGTIDDQSGQVDLEEDMDLELDLDIGEINYRAGSDINPDGTWTIAVPSQFSDFSVHAYVDDLPSGYQVVSSPEDGIDPGDDGIVVSIAPVQYDQFVRATVVDDNGDPVTNVQVIVDAEFDVDPEWMAGEVDASGEVVVPIVEPGLWYINVEPTDSAGNYLYPEGPTVAIQSDVDTFDIEFVLYEADATITGRLVDESGQVPVTTSNDEMDVWAQVEIDGETYLTMDNDETFSNGTFTIHVPSQFPYYTMHAEMNGTVPEGYGIVVTPQDSVAPGDTGVVVSIEPFSKFLVVKVADEAGAGLSGWNVYIEGPGSWGEREEETDAQGEIILGAVPGEYEIVPDEEAPSYLKSEDFVIEFPSDSDTVHVVINAISTDEVISGTVSTQLTEVDTYDDFYVGAYTEHETIGELWNEASVSPDGTYEIPVNSGYTYEVGLGHESGLDIAIKPAYYEEVAAGDSGVDFEILAADGWILGSVDLGMPSDSFNDVWVWVIDSTDTSVFEGDFDEETLEYEIPLPNGNYTMFAYYELNSDPEDSGTTVTLNVTIADDDVTVNLTANGLEIPGSTKKPFAARPLVFDLSAYPNPYTTNVTLRFSSPTAGKAMVDIFDMSGRQIKAVRTQVEGGVYYVRLDAQKTGLSAGQYMARLRIDGERDYSKTVRLIQAR